MIELGKLNSSKFLQLVWNWIYGLFRNWPCKLKSLLEHRNKQGGREHIYIMVTKVFSFLGLKDRAINMLVHTSNVLTFQPINFIYYFNISSLVHLLSIFFSFMITWHQLIGNALTMYTANCNQPIKIYHKYPFFSSLTNDKLAYKTLSSNSMSPSILFLLYNNC